MRCAWCCDAFVTSFRGSHGWDRVRTKDIGQRQLKDFVAVHNLDMAMDQWRDHPIHLDHVEQ
jgi:hypothetical protein